MSTDLAPFWAKLDMPALRAEAKASIDQDIKHGFLKNWAQVESLILPFPRGDISIEGEEVEAALAPDEKPFDDDTESESDFGDDDLAHEPISDAADGSGGCAGGIEIP